MADSIECNLFLLTLTSVPRFLETLSKSNLEPLISAKVSRWVIPPTVLSTDALVTKEGWNLVLCFAGPSSIPEECQQFIQHSWTASFRASADLVSSYASTLSQLATHIPDRSEHLNKLVSHGSNTSADYLEITPELKNWMELFSQQKKNPSIIMLNLLAFKDIEKYGKYRQALGGQVGTRHGLKPLLFGEVTECSSTSAGDKEWDMVAFVYYPSILHFGDMLADEEYQEVSHRYRFGSLLDNPILCLYND